MTEFVISLKWINYSDHIAMKKIVEKWCKENGIKAKWIGQERRFSYPKNSKYFRSIYYHFWEVYDEESAVALKLRWSEQ